MNIRQSVVMPSQTFVKRSMNDNETRGGTKRYHQIDPISPVIQKSNTTAVVGNNQSKLPGHLKNGWVFIDMR
jgi:hypothetical protein